MVVFDPKDETSSDQFLKWTEEHIGAFFINCKSPSDMMLHKVPCGHFVFKEVVNLVANKKACSSSRRKLEIWAEEHGDESLKVCSTCKP
jgi:hypothetical protein